MNIPVTLVSIKAISVEVQQQQSFKTLQIKFRCVRTHLSETHLSETESYLFVRAHLGRIAHLLRLTCVKLTWGRL